MSVGTTPGKGRVECLICGDDVHTAGKYVRNAKQCICGGIVHDGASVNTRRHYVTATSRRCS